MTVLSDLRAAAGRRLRHLAPARRQRWALATAVLRAQGPATGGVFLDAGCGDGLFTARLAGRDPARRVVAADLSPDAVTSAAVECRRLGLHNVLVVRADLTRAFVRPACDVVLALECLSEIPDDAAALSTLASALKPGGLFIGHVPLAGWRPVLRGSADRWRHEVRHGYVLDDLAEMMRSAGLELRAVRLTQRDVVTLAQELRDRWKNAPAIVRAALYPVMAAAAALDTAGITRGSPRGVLLVARRAATTSDWRSRPAAERSARSSPSTTTTTDRPSP
jgi:SAM-dependent methyltransferase